MKNKLLLVILIISMIFTLSACGIIDIIKKDEPIQSNQKITIDGVCDYEIKEAMVLKTVKDNGISLMTSEGMKNFCLLMNIKNLGRTEVDASKCINVKLTFNNKQIYDNVDYYAIDAFKIGSNLMPLKEYRLYCVIKIPDEVASQPENLKIKIKLKDKSYIYDGNIISAYDFVDKVSELVDRYYEQYNKFSNLLSYEIPFETNMERVINKIFTTASSSKTEIDNILNELSELTPPSCYQDGYNALKQNLSIYNEVMTTLSDTNKIHDPNVYTEAGNKIQDTDFIQSLETVKTNMPFLKDTKINNIK